jgi:hypothetical protein
VKLVFATKMKCAAVATLISLAFVSQASAVLRPLFPIKPAAPTNCEVIITGDELVLPSAKKPLLPQRASQGSQRLDGYGVSVRRRQLCSRHSLGAGL